MNVHEHVVNVNRHPPPRHDDGKGPVASLDLNLVQTMLNHGDGKRRRLAGARLGAAQHVVTGADDGDGLRLNRRGLVVFVEFNVQHDLRILRVEFATGVNQIKSPVRTRCGFKIE